MAKIAIKVDGLTEARKKFAHLRGTVAGDEMQAVLGKAARIIASEGERLAPVRHEEGGRVARYGKQARPGQLKRAFRAGMGRLSRTFLQAFAFTLKQVAPHAHLVEFGTKPHAIKPKKAGGRLWFGRHPVREVQHPGAKPVRFFRDAVRNKRAAVKKDIEAGLKRLLENATR